jgi:TAK1-binding protein 1
LYGVFNGIDGSCVSDFAAQRLPAEILLGQLNDNTSPAEVKEVLREAFLAVESSYFESIDDLLAE